MKCLYKFFKFIFYQNEVGWEGPHVKWICPKSLELFIPCFVFNQMFSIILDNIKKKNHSFLHTFISTAKIRYVVAFYFSNFFGRQAPIWVFLLPPQCLFKSDNIIKAGRHHMTSLVCFLFDFQNWIGNPSCRTGRLKTFWLYFLRFTLNRWNIFLFVSLKLKLSLFINIPLMTSSTLFVPISRTSLRSFCLKWRYNR